MTKLVLKKNNIVNSVPKNMKQNANKKYKLKLIFNSLPKNMAKQ